MAIHWTPVKSRVDETHMSSRKTPYEEAHGLVTVKLTFNPKTPPDVMATHHPTGAGALPVRDGRAARLQCPPRVPTTGLRAWGPEGRRGRIMAPAR